MTLKSRLVCAVAISCICGGIAGINHCNTVETISWAVFGFGAGLLIDIFLTAIGFVIG